MALPQSAVDFNDVHVEEVYHRATQIRHAAVHRLPINNVRIRQAMIPDAITLASGLKDGARRQRLVDIQRAFLGGPGGEPDILKLALEIGIDPTEASDIVAQAAAKAAAQTAAKVVPAKRSERDDRDNPGEHPPPKKPRVWDETYGSQSFQLT